MTSLIRLPFARSLLRLPIRQMSSGRGAHMNNSDDPSTISADAKKSQQKKKDTSKHFNKDGGWTEETASSAEAAIKADRGHHGKHTDLKKLQKESVEVLQGKKK